MEVQKLPNLRNINPPHQSWSILITCAEQQE